MDSNLLAAFRDEARFQCFCLLKANAQIDRLLRLTLRRSLRSHEIDELFCEIQNCLVAAANLSKLFWDGGAARSRERKPLRDSFGITDTSPLKPRVVRDHFEHQDERLERWSQSSAYPLRFMYIGAGLGYFNVPPKSLFRGIDRFTKEVAAWDKRVRLDQLVNETNKIMAVIEAEAQRRLKAMKRQQARRGRAKHTRRRDR